MTLDSRNNTDTTPAHGLSYGAKQGIILGSIFGFIAFALVLRAVMRHRSRMEEARTERQLQERIQTGIAAQDARTIFNRSPPPAYEVEDAYEMTIYPAGSRRTDDIEMQLPAALGPVYVISVYEDEWERRKRCANINPYW